MRRGESTMIASADVRFSDTDIYYKVVRSLAADDDMPSLLNAALTEFSQERQWQPRTRSHPKNIPGGQALISDGKFSQTIAATAQFQARVISALDYYSTNAHTGATNHADRWLTKLSQDSDAFAGWCNWSAIEGACGEEADNSGRHSVVDTLLMRAASNKMTGITAGAAGTEQQTADGVGCVVAECKLMVGVVHCRFTR